LGTALEENKQLKSDTNFKLAQMVKVIGQIGPDIPEIARRIKAYKETVRYWYKENLIKKGFAVSAMVNHSKLGLTRMVILADLEENFESYAPTLFTAMNELCYIVGFERTLPEGRYIVQASVPNEFVESYADFIAKLKDVGIFRSVEVIPFEYVRNVPMRADFFDFRKGEWDFDWSSPRELRADIAMSASTEIERFDTLDLYILKELHIDPDRSMIDISGTLKSKHNLETNYKTLVWHYTNHVQKFIPGYRVSWTGTRYDRTTEKAMHRKHSYMRVDVIVRNLTVNERMILMAEMNRLPFIWGEAAGKSYYVQFAFPTDTITEAFEFLTSALASVKDRANYYVMDQRNALNFTFSYQLYDGEQKRWRFEKEELLARFGNLVVKIKGGAG
jgi:hypothetical protein